MGKPKKNPSIIEVVFFEFLRKSFYLNWIFHQYSYMFLKKLLLKKNDAIFLWNAIQRGHKSIGGKQLGPLSGISWWFLEVESQ